MCFVSLKITIRFKIPTKRGLRMEFDLHTHTTASDGSMEPGELVCLAKELGLEGIAITDHDTVEGLEEGLFFGRAYDVEVIPGIELSTDFEGHEVHLLGYFIDWRADGLKQALQEMTRQRISRIQKMLLRLSELGFPLDFAEIQEIAGAGVVGRPHLAVAMVNAGYVNDVQEAFSRFLAKGAPAYVPREKIDLPAAVRLVQEAKGIPVLAHPGLLKDLTLVRRIIDYGIQGMEVDYPDHTSSQREYFWGLCRVHGLIPTGGSDFHGKIKAIPLGKCGASRHIVEQLRRKREEY